MRSFDEAGRELAAEHVKLFCRLNNLTLPPEGMEIESKIAQIHLAGRDSCKEALRLARKYLLWYARQPENKNTALEALEMLKAKGCYVGEE